jgi:protocatechuate 3,4-dioxygenase beta subunit
VARLTPSAAGALLLAAALLSGCERLITRPSLYATVSAQVMDRTGAPVPGARLVLYTGQRPMGYGTTDAMGQYTFQEVPEGVYGVLAVPPAGYERFEALVRTPKPSDVVDQLQVLGGAQVPARLTFLKRGAGSVEVVVREPGSVPLPGLTTVLYGPSGEVQRGTTDASGRLRFRDIPFGLYGVVVERPALYRDSGEVALPYTDGLIIDDGSIAEVPFLFEKCLGSVAAQVADQDGRAVPGAQLVFYRGGTVLNRDTLTTTMAVRRYGPLLCGDYGVSTVVPRGYTAANVRGSGYLDGLRVRRNGQLEATLRVHRMARGTLVVTIRDQGNRPVPEARVVLYNSTGVIRDQRTDANGRLVMDTVLMSESHGVRVVNPRGYLLGEGRGISFADQLLLADGEVRELPFRMERTGRATVEVRVADQEGRPVPATRVEIYTGAGLDRDARTGSDGAVTIPNLVVATAQGVEEYGVRVLAPPGYIAEEGRGFTFQDGVRFADGELRRFTFRFRRTTP